MIAVKLTNLDNLEIIWTLSKVRTPRNCDDLAKARAKLVGQIKSARVEKSKPIQLEKPASTSRPYDDDLDQSIKFSARIQSSRRNKEYSKRHELSASPRYVPSRINH